MPQMPMPGPQQGPAPMPPQGAPANKTADQAFKENLSMADPGDAYLLLEQGKFSKDMTVRDFFNAVGINVDGPLVQFKAFMEQEMAKADPMNKMNAMAGADPMVDPVQMKMSGMSPDGDTEYGEPSGSLDDLVRAGGR